MQLAPILSSHLQSLHLHQSQHSFAHHPWGVDMRHISTPCINSCFFLHINLCPEPHSADIFSFECPLPHAADLSANALRTITDIKPASAHALSHAASTNSKPIPDLRSPQSCSEPSSKIHAPPGLWQAWRGYSPNCSQVSAVPYVGQGRLCRYVCKRTAFTAGAHDQPGIAIIVRVSDWAVQSQLESAGCSKVYKLLQTP